MEKVIDFVSDRHPENSIKGGERDKQANEKIILIVNGNQIVPSKFKNIADNFRLCHKIGVLMLIL